MNKLKEILPEDVELTEEIKTLFKDKDGKYYLSEKGAREKLATHFKCSCGNGIREKFRIYCDNCEPPEKPDLNFKEWNGTDALYFNDEYFWDLDSLLEHFEENDLKPEEQVVYICEPSYYFPVSSDYWEDIMANEDGELPKIIQEKLDELNEAIKDYDKPASWSPSKYKTIIKSN